MKTTFIIIFKISTSFLNLSVSLSLCKPLKLFNTIPKNTIKRGRRLPRYRAYYDMYLKKIENDRGISLSSIVIDFLKAFLYNSLSYNAHTCIIKTGVYCKSNSSSCKDDSSLSLLCWL